MNRTIGIAIATAIAAALAASALAQNAPKVDPAKVDSVVAATFKSTSPEWRKRIEQDDTQRVCSQYRPGDLPDKERAAIIAREEARIVMPADGKVIGDWKAGEKIAQTGTGGQFSDGPNTARGGNCYACHQLSKTELSYGTLGPTLIEYGKNRSFSADEAKAAYAKIYNPHSVLPCSEMPRFGANEFLNEQQIKDLVALLFDPESPVNK